MTWWWTIRTRHLSVTARGIVSSVRPSVFHREARAKRKSLMGRLFLTSLQVKLKWRTWSHFRSCFLDNLLALSILLCLTLSLAGAPRLLLLVEQKLSIKGKNCAVPFVLGLFSEATNPPAFGPWIELEIVKRKEEEKKTPCNSSSYSIRVERSFSYIAFFDNKSRSTNVMLTL